MEVDGGKVLDIKDSQGRRVIIGENGNMATIQTRELPEKVKETRMREHPSDKLVGLIFDHTNADVQSTATISPKTTDVKQKTEELPFNVKVLVDGVKSLDIKDSQGRRVIIDEDGDMVTVQIRELPENVRETCAREHPSDKLVFDL